MNQNESVHVMDTTDTLIVCPLCNNQNKDQFPVKYSHKPEWEVVVCGNCSFTFIPAHYRKVVSYEEYKDDSTVQQMKKGNNWIKIQRQKLRLSFLKKFIRSGKILDIGAGWGHFLLAAQQEGFETMGVEYDRHSAGYAREELGLDVRQIDFFKLPETEQFDVLTMWDVLEHLDDPDRVIEKCARLTRANGYILIQVPQIDSYVAQKQKEKWIHLSLDHVNYFSRKTITALMEKHGYEVLKIKSSFELKFLLTHSLASRLKKKKAGPQPAAEEKVFFEDRAATPAEGAALFNKFTNIPRWMLWCMVKANNVVYNTLSAMNVGEEMMVIARKKK